MKLAPYTNKYGYERVKCPFCGYEANYRKGNGSDPFMDLKRHITNQAKNEALKWMMFSKEKMRKAQMPEHLLYYQNHTSDERVVKVEIRAYDEDMHL